MDLNQRTVSAVMQQLLMKVSGVRAPGLTMEGLASRAAAGLAAAAKRAVIVVDEVDQLISRSGSKAAAGALSLETLFSLPSLPGAPAVAVIAIANAVDLLERTTMFSSSFNCGSLLFEPYSKAQLTEIVNTRVRAAEGGEGALQALGTVKVQLRVMQVAKNSGDCRQVQSLIEEALYEAKLASASTNKETTCSGSQSSPASEAEQKASRVSSSSSSEVGSSPKRNPKAPVKSGVNDPLKGISSLPLEQQILLATLATSKHEATKLSDVCKRYKDLCKNMKQAESLGNKSQVAGALECLEHRGLLALRNYRKGIYGRSKCTQVGEPTVEVWVSCEDLLERVHKAKPELKMFTKYL